MTSHWYLITLFRSDTPPIVNQNMSPHFTLTNVDTRQAFNLLAHPFVGNPVYDIITYTNIDLLRISVYNIARLFHQGQNFPHATRWVDDIYLVDDYIDYPPFRGFT